MTDDGTARTSLLHEEQLQQQQQRTGSDGSSSNHFAILNLVSYAINVAVTYGIGVGGLLDLPTNAELSQKYQTLVTPIGWAFAIWGIIFLLQAMWVVVPWIVLLARNNNQNSSSSSSSSTKDIVRYNYLIIVLLQAAWTWSFSHEWIFLSTIVMMALAVALWNTVVRIWKNNKNNNAASDSSSSVSYYALQILPFTLHTGWIAAAAAVNLNVLWVSLEIKPAFQFASALLCLVGLGGIALLYALPRDSTIPLVAAWALIGIYASVTDERTTNPDYEETTRTNGTSIRPNPLTDRFSDAQLDTVRYAAAALSAILVVAVLWRKVMKH